MGCRESKLVVSTTEPVKKTKSLSCRSTSRRVDRLDSNSTITSTSTTIKDNEKPKTSKDIVKQEKHGKSVESKGCQTIDYYPKEGIEEKKKAKSSQQDLVKPEKETIEEEGGIHEESLTIGEENKEEMKEVEICKEQVKIKEAEAQNKDEQVQATKEKNKEGKPDEGNIEDISKPSQEQNGNGNDNVESGKKQEQEQYADEKVEVEKQGQNANNEDKGVEKVDEEIIEPIEVETETVFEEDTNKIVSSNVDHQPQVIEQEEEEAHKVEEKVETIIVNENREASNLNKEVIVGDKEEVEQILIEIERTSKERNETIAPKDVDNGVSTNFEKTHLNEQEDGTNIEEKITVDSKA